MKKEERKKEKGEERPGNGGFLYYRPGQNQNSPLPSGNPRLLSYEEDYAQES